MNRLIARALRTSPQQLIAWAKRKCTPCPRPTWNVVADGYGKGIELYLPTGLSEYQEMIDGTYDADLFQAAAETLSGQDAVVWDVGAHVGYSAMVFGKMLGAKGTVVAFEPNPANAERLKMHVERNKENTARVIHDASALSEDNGIVSFRFHNNVDGSESTGGHLSDVCPPLPTTVYSGFETIEVETKTIDQLFRANTYPPPDLLKVDVEGAEGLVLRGATETLAEAGPRLLIEIHHVSAMFECLSLLHSLRYQSKMITVDSVSRCFIGASRVDC